MTSTAASATDAGTDSTSGTRRPFKFGAKATDANSAADWSDRARQAEDLGYSSFRIDDHFGNQLAPIPALMAAAAATSTIKVGTLVAGNDFRNPVVLAKESATIDLLSDGRFVLGIGAGWSKADYSMGGVRQDDADTRIDRLEEAVEIIRRYWSGDTFTFAGDHYQVSELTGYPEPVSEIPVLIGGGGQKVLSLAARCADIVGVNPKIVNRSINPQSMATAAEEAVDERMRWIKAAAGDRYPQLEIHLQVFVARVTDTPDAVAAELAPAFGLPPEVILAAPYFQIGSVAKIADNIRELRERWDISYIAMPASATEAMAPVVAELASS